MSGSGPPAPETPPPAAARRAPIPPARRSMGPVTFGRLELISFIHSGVYLALLVCAFALGNPEPATFILGLSHGLLWIGMSLVCLAAAQRRVIPFWLAVTVAVLGGLGPFAGSLGFIYCERRRGRSGAAGGAGESPLHALE